MSVCGQCFRVYIFSRGRLESSGFLVSTSIHAGTLKVCVQGTMHVRIHSSCLSCPITVATL